MSFSNQITMDNTLSSQFSPWMKNRNGWCWICTANTGRYMLFNSKSSGIFLILPFEVQKISYYFIFCICSALVFHSLSIISIRHKPESQLQQCSLPGSGTALHSTLCSHFYLLILIKLRKALGRYMWELLYIARLNIIILIQTCRDSNS